MVADDRPDIIIIITDQHRADVSRREGFPLDTTPFLDELAQDGVWFNRAYTTSPLCCPARTSLLTGRWPSAHRVVQNPAMREAVFGSDLFREARDAGYATAYIGKNHTYLSAVDVDYFVDYSHEGRIEDNGDPQTAEFFTWLAALRHRTAEMPTPFPIEVQDPVLIVDETLKWISTVSRDRPLLTVVSFPEPHNPYQVPEPYFSMFPPETLPSVEASRDSLDGLSYTWRYLHEIGDRATVDYDGIIDRARSNYFGMLRLIDDQVRRLHGELADRHQERPRIIAMTADHGDFVGEYGLVRKGAEIPDILARIPLLVSGDAIASAETGAAHPAHVSIADLMPTLCEAMGREIPFGAQGRSLWPMLTGRPYPEAEFSSAYIEQGMGGLPYKHEDVTSDMPGLILDGPDGEARFDELNAVTQSGRRRKIRSGDWSLYADITGDFRLFNLVDDPRELENRWNDPTANVTKIALLQLLAIWQLRAEDPLPVVPNGYPLKTDPHGYVASETPVVP